MADMSMPNTGDIVDTGMPEQGFTWQDLLNIFANSRGVSPVGINSPQQPFIPLGSKQQNPGIPLYNPLQPLNIPKKQQQQSSVNDIVKYIKFFQGLFDGGGDIGNASFTGAGTGTPFM